MVEGIPLDEDGAWRVDEDATCTIVTDEIVGEGDAGRTSKVLHTHLSLGGVVYW